MTNSTEYTPEQEPLDLTNPTDKSAFSTKFNISIAILDLAIEEIGTDVGKVSSWLSDRRYKVGSEYEIFIDKIIKNMTDDGLAEVASVNQFSIEDIVRIIQSKVNRKVYFLHAKEQTVLNELLFKWHIDHNVFLLSFEAITNKTIEQQKVISRTLINGIYEVNSKLNRDVQGK